MMDKIKIREAKELLDGAQKIVLELDSLEVKDGKINITHLHKISFWAYMYYIGAHALDIMLIIFIIVFLGHCSGTVPMSNLAEVIHGR